jgi:starvation-inducible DNA-binding protein
MMDSKEMMMNKIAKSYAVLLADLYVLLVKTQNYHWHVKGPHFKPLHVFFQELYTQVFDTIDLVAERMVTMGFVAPASLIEINELKRMADGDAKLDSAEMLMDLENSFKMIVDDLDACIKLVKVEEDEASLTFLTDLLVSFEKTIWMIKASASGF